MKWNKMEKIYVIPDVSSGSLPTFPLHPRSPFGVQQRAHASTIQTAGLHQVDNGKAIADARLHVPHPEVEPLGVLSGVQISTQSQLIVMLTTANKFKYKAQINIVRCIKDVIIELSIYCNSHLECFLKVSALKTRFKD